MIVLRCEMWPGGDQLKARELGCLVISNTGQGTKDRGMYSARLTGKDRQLMGTEWLNDWPRLRHHVWDLVTVLLCLMRPGTVRRYRKLWEAAVKEMQMDEILQALTDPENQPHQWIGNPEKLRLALTQCEARDRKLWWIISVHGWGEIALHGTEAEAEEMRRHKAHWEAGAARKRLADLTLNSDCVLITAAEDGMAKQ